MNLIASLPNDDDLFEVRLELILPSSCSSPRWQIYRDERETNGMAYEERQKERLKQVCIPAESIPWPDLSPLLQ
jgi:hypothetical protein